MAAGPSSGVPGVDYEHLDHAAVARVMGAVITEYFRASGGVRTYDSLAEAIRGRMPEGEPDGIAGSAIKTFHSRVRSMDSDARINRNNTTLGALYGYFMSALDELDPSVRDILEADDHWEVLTTSEPDWIVSETGLADAAHRYNDWALAKDDVLREHLQVMEGSYAVVRKSVLGGSQLVMSHLRLRLDRNGALLARHVYEDRFSGRRTSFGFVTPFRNHSAAINLVVERYMGAEYILLGIPIQEKFKQMMGVMNTITYRRIPISAPCFIQRMSSFWRSIEKRPDGPRFGIDDLQKEIVPDEWIAVNELLNREGVTYVGDGEHARARG